MAETDYARMVREAEEAAALRLRRGVRPPGGVTRAPGREEGAITAFHRAMEPQSAGEAAAGIALAPVAAFGLPTRAATRLAAPALGALGTMLFPDEAQAKFKAAVPRASLPKPGSKAWQDYRDPNAPFPQYAEEYPAIGPPEMLPKTKPTFAGETYPAKKLTPEAEEFMKARTKIMKNMEETGYTPYFDPAKRFNVDPSNYPPANVDTLTEAVPKKQATVDEYLKVIGAPQTRERLRAAHARGEELGNADRWYAMGQLESGYTKELGMKKGREAYLQEFAVPMAATTSGNDPRANYLMSHFLEYKRKRGEPLPATHEMPATVGGRRPAMNVRDYTKAVLEGGGYPALGIDQPKMHNFARSFVGDLRRGVMDEQMAEGMLAGAPAGFADRARKGAFGLLEQPLHAEAKAAGKLPGEYQDVAWAGFRNTPGKPMIGEVNDAIERTHRLTGMPRSEIFRRGVIRKEIPIYGLGGALAGSETFRFREE